MEHTSLESFCQQHKDAARIPSLSAIDAELLVQQCDQSGPARVVLGLVSRSVPKTEVDERVFAFFSRDRRVDTCIHDNILGSITRLYCATPKDTRVTAMTEAFQQLYNCALEYSFDPPTPNKPFDAKAHDEALIKFRKCFTAGLERLHDLHNAVLVDGTNPFTLAFLVYARAQFEARGFQAPPRLSAEEAVRDAMGETDLWAEYLQAWGLAKYL